MYHDRSSTHPKRFLGCGPHRIRTFGVHWTSELLSWVSGPGHLDALNTAEPGSLAYQDAYEKVRTSQGSGDSNDWKNWESRLSLRKAVLRKHGRLKTWLHPEPGVAFTYEGWKAGRVAKAVVPPRDIGRANAWYGLREHQYCTVALQEQFRDQGLQVVVEIGKYGRTYVPSMQSCKRKHSRK